MPHNPLFETIVSSVRALRELTPSKVYDFVVHAPENYEVWWTTLFRESPQHVIIETLLILFIIWLLFIRRTVDPVKASKADNLSSKDIEWLLDTWNPEPLAAPLTEKEKSISDHELVIEKIEGGYATIRGIEEPALLASTFDFFGYSHDEQIKDQARATLDKYGCGSCGPRGFYGTIDVHLQLEDQIAKFMGTEEAICYSEGASAVTSAIPAFAKKGDLLIIDEACAEPILTGANLSRATVRYFRHNDMADLEKILNAVKEEDARLKRDATQQRRFIVVEGIYKNTGEICRLKEIMALKEKYFYRLILDECMSFGALGAKGRGVTEHFGFVPSDVEILIFPLDTVLASVGGVCIGSRPIVDHQRLSGAGYCYSASTAPFLATAAIAALTKLQDNPTIVKDLERKSTMLYTALQNIPGLKLLNQTSSTSPVCQLVLRNELNTIEDEQAVIQSIVDHALRSGVAVVACKFALVKDKKPSIMVCSNALYEQQQILDIADAITIAAKKYL